VTAPGLRLALVIAATEGGTGRHAAMLAAGCSQSGMHVTVLGPASARSLFPGPPPATAQSGDWYLPLEIASRVRPARDAAAVARLRRLLRRGRPDVVHAHGLRAAAIASLALALIPPGGPAARVTSAPGRRGRPPLVVTVHNAPPPGRGAALVYRMLERLAARRADAVLCVSPDLAQRMRRAGARDVGRAVVPAPPAPAPSAGAVAGARAGIAAGGRPVILAAGRLAPQKGLDVLLDAAARLRGRQSAPLLAIAGQGPLAGQLAARARAGGVDARFLGPRSDIPALLAVADVVVVPSRWEGQPLIVQEALRAARPLVASSVPGIAALTGEDAALLVPPADPAALAAAIASVLDDPALARRLEAAAAARAAALPAPADAISAITGVYAKLASALPRDGRAGGSRRKACQSGDDTGHRAQRRV
jgi:glycosyltransferase involved in cell wall biosynthesis